MRLDQCVWVRAPWIDHSDANRPQLEPKGKVWYFPFGGVCGLFHLADKLRGREHVHTYKQTRPLRVAFGNPCRRSLFLFFCFGAFSVAEAIHLRHSHLFIIIHAWHMCHLHTPTRRMRVERKSETGPRSVPGILIISSTRFWRSVLLYGFSSVSSYLSLP